MKLERWMDLAQAALDDDRQDGPKHEDDQTPGP